MIAHPKKRFVLLVWVAFGGSIVPAGLVIAQNDKNATPIHYDSAVANDPVAELITQVEAGTASIDWDDQHGWLPSLLANLNIPETSQTLVFSKTSQQIRKIRPSYPRAIYFSDNVYVGYVINGDFIEIGAVDRQQGARFYLLDQAKAQQVKFSRATDQCMSCHETRKTQKVPGFLVRSVFPTKSGHPEFSLGTTTTDHSTPLEKRFGGWYVTGQHGTMRHRGNVTVQRNFHQLDQPIDREVGANLLRLPRIANEKRHLQPTSDIVALMLLEHQVQFHNLVTKASYTTRQAQYRDQQMNRVLERPADYRSDSTVGQIDRAADRLVEYALFSGEYQLESPVQGSGEFVRQFSASAIRTADGRSLRDLDLQNRLLKYPCSYLVYTKSFLALPPTVRRLVKSKMLDVLTNENQSAAFEHLSKTDRQNILQILRETHPLFQKDSR